MLKVQFQEGKAYHLEDCDGKPNQVFLGRTPAEVSASIATHVYRGHWSLLLTNHEPETYKVSYLSKAVVQSFVFSYK